MNTEKKINYKRFNKLISTFLSDLKKTLPNEKKIKVVSSQVETLILLTPKKIFKSCVKFIYPHKEQILNKNEQFFLEQKLNVQKDYLSEALELKTLWTTKLSPQNKEVIWKYFKILILLIEKEISS